MSASAGTFVGAALETAGMYYQSYALDLLGYSLQGLVVLVFVIGAMAALVAHAFRTGDRSILLILLGPALYLSMVYERSSVPPVEWSEATTEQEQGAVENAVAGIAAQKKYVPMPSSLFANFDRLVSSFVKQTSDALRAANDQVDTGMIVKTQLVGYLMNPKITDPGLKELLHLSLLGECRAMIQAGQEMSDSKNRPAERCEWGKNYEELGSKTEFRLTPNASKYVASLAVDVPMLLQTPVVDDLGEELGNLKTQLASLRPPVDCDVIGTDPTGKQDAAVLAEAAIEANALVRNQILQTVGGTTAGLPRTADSIDALAEYYQQRDANVAAKNQELSSESFTCHEIWNIVYAGLTYEAAMDLETVKTEGAAKGFDPQKLSEDLAKMTGVGGTAELVRAISRKLFRLENIAGSSSAIIQEYADRGPDIQDININDSEDNNAKIRQETLDAQWSGQATLIQTAMTLPYYQGLVLFFLAISFPFFALLLAVPGRAFGFFMWFGLWFWVRSWDIGYAFVSMIDKVLYSIFVVKMNSGYVTASKTLDLDFSAAVAALRDADPTFDVGTYYNIMAVCLMAIPVISAQLIVAIASDLAGLIRGQLQLAQERAANSVKQLNAERTAQGVAQRWLGSGAFGDVTAKVLNDAAKLIPLRRPLNSVTVIENNIQPSVLPSRTPNLISTAGNRTPLTLPNGGTRAPDAQLTGLIPRRNISRWEMIDGGQNLNPSEVVESPDLKDIKKKLDLSTGNQPRPTDDK